MPVDFSPEETQTSTIDFQSEGQEGQTIDFKPQKPTREELESLPQLQPEKIPLTTRIGSAAYWPVAAIADIPKSVGRLGAGILNLPFYAGQAAGLIPSKPTPALGGDIQPPSPPFSADRPLVQIPFEPTPMQPEAPGAVTLANKALGMVTPEVVAVTAGTMGAGTPSAAAGVFLPQMAAQLPQSLVERGRRILSPETTGREKIGEAAGGLTDVAMTLALAKGAIPETGVPPIPESPVRIPTGEELAMPEGARPRADIAKEISDLHLKLSEETDLGKRAALNEQIDKLKAQANVGRAPDSEKATQAATAPKESDNPAAIANALGLRWDGNTANRANYTLLTEDGKESTTITLPIDATLDQVHAKYLEKVKQYSSDPVENRPRSPRNWKKEDMEFARKLVEMTPAEIMQKARGFNVINLRIGENATPETIAELKELRQKAIDRRDKVLKEAADGTLKDPNELGTVTLLEQFYNEAIRKTEPDFARTEESSAPAAEPSPAALPSPSQPVPQAAAAPPSAPAPVEPTWMEKPLSFWEALTKNMPTGELRAKLANSLGVPNQPAKIIRQINKRIAEIRAQAEKPKAPEPAAAKLPVSETAAPTPEPPKPVEAQAPPAAPSSAAPAPTTPAAPAQAAAKVKGGGVLSALESAADEARLRLQKKRNQQGAMSGPIDPTDIDDIAIIGAAKVARGLTDFSKWSAEMVKEHGDSINPYLETVYGKSQSLTQAPAAPGPGAKTGGTEADPSPEAIGLSAGSPVLNKLQSAARNITEGVRQLFVRRDIKADLPKLMNAADNLPRMAGQQAGNSVRLRTSAADRSALTFVMQALKMSGEGISEEAAARLGKLEHAGDPIGYLKAKQTDMETLAQRVLNQGKKLNAQAAIDAANAMKFARENFNRLRPLADRTRGQFDAQFTREQRSGLDTDYERWYVPQRHEIDIFTASDRPIVLGHSRGGGPATGFKKAKVFEDYATAIENGFVPRTFDVADLLEHRVNQGERLVQRKIFFNNLRSITDPIDNKPLAMDIPRRVIQRADGTMDVQESVPLGYKPHEVIPGVRLAIHEGYSRLINALTATSQISESAAVGTLQDIAAVEKHISLALDTFHASRMMQAELALTGKVSLGARQRAGRALVEYKPSDLDAAVSAGAITQEMADWVRTPKPITVGGKEIQLSPHSIITLGAKNGLNIARFADAMYRDWLRNIPVTGAVNRWVFDKMTRSAIAQSFLVEFERVAKAHPEWDATRTARQVSGDLNVMFGNLQKESMFKNPSVRSINNILFLAPQWVEGLARREGRSLVQFAKVPADIAQGRGVRLGTVARGIGSGLSAYFIGTQLLNLMTRGKTTFSNPEPGHKMDAWIPDVTGKTTGFFISPLSVFGEITHDILRFSQQKPDLATAVSQVAENKLGNLGRFLEVLALGRDPMTHQQLIGTGRRAMTAASQVVPLPITLSQPARAIGHEIAPNVIRAPTPGGVQRQITASAGFKTEPVGSAQQQVRGLAQTWALNNSDPKIKAEAERHLKEQFATDYGDLRMALQRDRMADARRAYNELRQEGKTPRVIRDTLRHPHPFTGSTATERKFKESLTDEERKIYDDAINERRALYHRFNQMLEEE